EGPAALCSTAKPARQGAVGVRPVRIEKWNRLAECRARHATRRRAGAHPGAGANPGCSECRSFRDAGETQPDACHRHDSGVGALSITLRIKLVKSAIMRAFRPFE